MEVRDQLLLVLISNTLIHYPQVIEEEGVRRELDGTEAADSDADDVVERNSMRAEYSHVPAVQHAQFQESVSCACDF